MFINLKNQDGIEKLYQYYDEKDKEIALYIESKFHTLFPTAMDMLIATIEIMITFYFFGIFYNLKKTKVIFTFILLAKDIYTIINILVE